jgi:hypothetical protein
MRKHLFKNLISTPRTEPWLLNGAAGVSSKHS